MAARSRTQELHGVARDAKDAGSRGIYAEEREAVAELGMQVSSYNVRNEYD